MTEEQLAQLREAFLTAPESASTRVVAIALSIALVGAVLWLVRRRRLREEYTPIWLGVAFAMLLVSFELDWLRRLTRAIGAWTPSATIFFLGEVFLLGICLNFAVRLSQMSSQIRTLAQEVALLRAEAVRRAPESPEGEERA